MKAQINPYLICHLSASFTPHKRFRELHCQQYLLSTRYRNEYCKLLNLLRNRYILRPWSLKKYLHRKGTSLSSFKKILNNENFIVTVITIPIVNILQSKCTFCRLPWHRLRVCSYLCNVRANKMKPTLKSLLASFTLSKLTIQLC